MPTRLSMKQIAILLTLAGLCAVSADISRAQPRGKPVVIGEELEIESRVLGEQRPLMIAKPSGYDEGDEHYPVVYLLDGGPSNFRHTAGIVSFLDYAGRAPGMLLVAITNTNRDRDLTLATQSEAELRRFPVHGGADKFLDFIRDELMPWVNRTYRTRPYSILIGHSLGGLVAIHALTTRPAMFNAYVAVDPTLQWNNQAIVAHSEAFFKNTPRLEADLYMTMTEEGGASSAGAMKLAAILEERAPQGFRWTFQDMPGESHLSTLHRSIYSALDAIFDGWHLADPLDLYDKGGLAAVHKHFEEGGKRFGYERRTSPFIVSMIVYHLIRRGRFEEAAAVLEHDPDNYKPPWNQLEALGRAYAERGDTDRAIHYYELSLRSNPDNELAKRQLAQLSARTP